MTSKKIGKKTKKSLELEFAPLQAKVRLTPGKAIKIYREAQGLTQSNLAKKTGLKQSTISGLENDRLTLGLDRAKTLARALRVHPSALAFPDWDIDSIAA